jgi:hypothetical protein
MAESEMDNGRMRTPVAPLPALLRWSVAFKSASWLPMIMESGLVCAVIFDLIFDLVFAL